VHILLVNEEGRTEEALLLSSGTDRMRIMLRGHRDAVELRRVDGKWMYESGAAVEIGAVMEVDRPAEVEQEPARSSVQLSVTLARNALGHTRAN